MDYRISDHALAEMERRGITATEITAAMQSSDIRAGHGGRTVRQSVMAGYLIRAVVEHWHTPPVVVTVYRTSKLGKYGVAP